MFMESVAGSTWCAQPKQVSRKIGEIHKVETIKTPWDKFVEGLEVIGGCIVIVGIIAAIFS